MSEEETAREIAVKVIPDTVIYVADLRLKAEPVILAALRQRADDEREKVARWMIARSYATGHGDTIEDLLGELEAQVRERARAVLAAEEIASEIDSHER